MAIKTANLTLHDESALVKEFRKHGIDLDPAPSGIIFSENEEPEKVKERAKDAVRLAYERGFEAILVGGRADVVVYEYLTAKELGLRVFSAKIKDGKLLSIREVV